MRKISVAVTAAALAVSMLAAAIPAAAVTGYDSAYAGESAFVTLAPGQSNEFQVFFANMDTRFLTEEKARLSANATPSEARRRPRYSAAGPHQAALDALTL